MALPGSSEREASAWETAAVAFLTGAPPSLTFAPRASDPSAPAAETAVAAETATAPTPTVADLRAQVLKASLPPPQRKLLEGVVLLWHDHWDAAHEVAQSHEGQTDHDLLHAIGHRREGDYPNADYWFRSAGRHPVHTALSRAAAATFHSGDPLLALLVPSAQWSASAFTAEVKRVVSGGSDRGEALIRLQALEMRLFAGWLLSG